MRYLLVVFLAASLSSCGIFSSAGKVEAAALEGPVTKVTERHDTYVAEDANLSDLEKRTYLRSSELLRKVVEEAMK